MSAEPKALFLRPVGKPWKDGTQQFAVVETEIAPWRPTAVYGVGTHVLGSDGDVYVAQTGGLRNVDPVEGDGTRWQRTVR